MSCNNQGKGFHPAFRDDDTGRVELAKYKDGRQATMHLISGLPQQWAIKFDSQVPVHLSHQSKLVFAEMENFSLEMKLSKLAKARLASLSRLFLPKKGPTTHTN